MFSLLLGYYWLCFWLLLAIRLMIMIRGEGCGGQIKIETGKGLKVFEKLIIGGRAIIQRLALSIS